MCMKEETEKGYHAMCKLIVIYTQSSVTTVYVCRWVLMGLLVLTLSKLS